MSSFDSLRRDFMKRYAHYPFYAAAAVSVVGMFMQWEWVKGAWDGWFPAWAVAVGELIRVRNNIEAGVVEKVSKNFQRFAVASIVLLFVGMGGWFAYLKYVWGPANERAGVQEYLDARDKQLREQRGDK
jgi:hypothetical protein